MAPVGGGTPDVLLDDLWRLVGWGPVDEGGDEEMRRVEGYVRGLLRESGDALQYDEAAVQVIVRHEVSAAGRRDGTAEAGCGAW